jgi:polysaccharide export outer membrane protein
MSKFRGWLLPACCLAFALLASSCLPTKSFIYFQDPDSTHTQVQTGQPDRLIITKNAILGIFVSSVSDEASRYFNYAPLPGGGNSSANNYVVDVNGDIQLPLVGNIHVEGLTPLEARDTLKSRLGKYLIEPTVKLDVVNYNVTILGEVTRPGIYTVANEKVTLTEALALAGDLTLYGRRDNVMLVREENGKKNYSHFDLNARDLFSSPYYYLHSNDIIYVEPIKQKRFSAQTYYKVLPLLLSGLSLILVLLSVTN